MEVKPGIRQLNIPNEMYSN